MRVAIVGQGYVGLTIAVGAAGAGHEVIGFDVNAELVRLLNSGQSHIEGITDQNLHGFITSKVYRATTDASLINGSDVVVIAVPTPLTEAREPDLTYLHSLYGCSAMVCLTPNYRTWAINYGGLDFFAPVGR